MRAVRTAVRRGIRWTLHEPSTSLMKFTRVHESQRAYDGRSFGSSGKRMDRAYTSRSTRCLDTDRLIPAECNLPFLLTPRVRKTLHGKITLRHSATYYLLCAATHSLLPPPRHIETFQQTLPHHPFRHLKPLSYTAHLLPLHILALLILLILLSSYALPQGTLLNTAIYLRSTFLIVLTWTGVLILNGETNDQVL